MVPKIEFDPHAALGPRAELVEDALLVPYDDRRPNRRPKLGGVLRRDGSFVDASACYISEDRPQNRAPHPASWSDTVPQTRPGTWLFGGKHDNRFGHFLVETFARLWATELADTSVAGIVFLPKKVMPPGRAQTQFARTKALFSLVPDLPPVEIATEPARFERLIVAPQGCGAGTMAPGCPEFRDFMRRRFAPEIAPDGGDRIYISRTALRLAPGQVLFENVIEDAAAAEGFEVFHPQHHDIATQIARYRAASHILGVEGSAFHMVALANPPKARIGLIRRRMGDAPLGFVHQIEGITGRDCVDLSHVADWFMVEGNHPMANGILDLPGLFTELRATGFFASDHALPAQDKAAIEIEKQALADRILGRV